MVHNHPICTNQLGILFACWLFYNNSQTYYGCSKIYLNLLKNILCFNIENLKLHFYMLWMDQCITAFFTERKHWLAWELTCLWPEGSVCRSVWCFHNSVDLWRNTREEIHHLFSCIVPAWHWTLPGLPYPELKMTTTKKVELNTNTILDFKRQKEEFKSIISY